MNPMSGPNTRYRRCFASMAAGLALACFFFGPAFGAEGVLSGIVVCPDDAPVSGLEVVAGTQRTATDAAGAFQLSGLESGDLLLRLRGDAGEGRVNVSVNADDAPVRLRYPVLTTVVLLHDNDIHFNYNHMEAFEGKIQAVREQYDNVFLLSAGDMFVRHADRWARPHDLSFYREMCGQMISVMNRLAYDVCTLGNHELFYHDGYTREALEQAAFPLLGANIILDTDNAPPLEPYIVLETDNALRLAILGITRRSGGSDGVEMKDFVETAREYVHLAEDHHLFVALTHIGLNSDKALAEAVPELDLIIGGHSNHTLWSGLTVNDVLVAMAGGPPSGHRHAANPEWPKYLGKVKVVFENDRPVEKTATLMAFTAADALAATP